MEYEAVIGLEIHLELNCATKMFCDCPNSSSDEPNRNTCPICLWLPGAIPQFSQEALEKAAMTCLALHCELQEHSAFDQKVYYYPDLPKGFQLSQAHMPLARHGWLEVAGEDGKGKKMRIRHIHMEEDVAKLVHETEGRTPISLVDFNRAGVPLVEIVTEPDMRSPHDAMEFIRALRTQVRYAGSSDCSMESGTLRVDANISIRPKGTDQMNTKVEVKNMNSIRHVGDAISYEIQRQIGLLQSGEPIVLHTRLWDPDNKMTTAMRSKFQGPCVPDPCVAQIVITEAWREEMRSRLPEMPSRKAERFMEQYGLTREEALLMSADRELSEYFEAVKGLGIQAKTATHWLTTQFLPALKDHGQAIGDTTIQPERFAALLSLMERNEINAPAAKEVLHQLFQSEETPAAIVERSGFRQISDAVALEEVVDQILAKNPAAVADYRNGVAKALGFLVGQAMQASGGKANPKLLREILISKL